MEVAKKKCSKRHWTCFWHCVVLGKTTTQVASETYRSSHTVCRSVRAVKEAIRRAHRVLLANEDIEGIMSDSTVEDLITEEASTVTE